MNMSGDLWQAFCALNVKRISTEAASAGRDWHARAGQEVVRARWYSGAGARPGRYQPSLLGWQQAECANWGKPRVWVSKSLGGREEGEAQDAGSSHSQARDHRHGAAGALAAAAQPQGRRARHQQRQQSPRG